MTNPWSGRFEVKPDAEFLAFSSSLAEDQLLIHDDVVGSLAHAAALVDAGILDEQEYAQIRVGLRKVREELLSGQERLREDLEDVHMNVETLLRKHAGDAAGKLHTARSRNDQVALDLRLFTRRELLSLTFELLAYADALLTQATKHAGALMPGFTHMQPAQPITFGHMCHAHAERAIRDAERALQAFERANISPLGAAALAGTSFGIEPEKTAERLAFSAAFDNSLDAVSDRDFLAEAAFVASMVGVHLSGLGEEFVLFSSPAYGFLKMPEALTSGSSIMPQKRNPDAAELLRGRAGPALGELQSVLSLLKGLPLAYNRDLQEAKAPVVRTLPRAIASVRIARALVDGLEPDTARMAKALEAGYPEATELADLLAQRGMPFREAHHVVGALVKEAEKTKTPLRELAIEHPAFAGEDLSDMGPEEAARRKVSPGGTAPGRVQEAAKAARVKVNALRAVHDQAAAWVTTAEAALLDG